MTPTHKWTLEKIRVGMEQYKNLYGRYPSTLDFDKVDFLPTSRMIQRNFGGIVKLKEALGVDAVSDYRKGDYRSSVAHNTYTRAVDYEKIFYEFLVSKLPEVRIHEHKILRPGNVCCDFFVYTSDTDGFAIDLFYAQDLFSLARVVNIKLKRYKNVSYKTYFVLVGNESITTEEINKLIGNKKVSLPEHIQVITESYFKTSIFNRII